MSPYEQISKFLKTAAIDYDELTHQVIYSAQDSAAANAQAESATAKCLLLKTRTNYILVVLAGSRKLDSKKLKKTLMVKDLRFASPAEVQLTMRCLVGACYPFGSLAGIQTYIDGSLQNQPHLLISPGLHDKTIKLKLTDYLRLEQPRQVDISA